MLENTMLNSTGSEIFDINKKVFTILSGIEKNVNEVEKINEDKYTIKCCCDC